MSKREKSIYDKIYYQKPEVKIKKKARARTLLDYLILIQYILKSYMKKN